MVHPSSDVHHRTIVRPNWILSTKTRIAYDRWWQKAECGMDMMFKISTESIKIWFKNRKQEPGLLKKEIGSCPLLINQPIKSIRFLRMSPYVTARSFLARSFLIQSSRDWSTKSKPNARSECFFTHHHLLSPWLWPRAANFRVFVENKQ